MEELQLALTTARIDQRNFGLWINSWQIGQTLNALVTGQRPGGELVLRVAGQQITATADIPVQQGANLLLEVKQLRPIPTLRVLNPAPEAGAARLGGTLQLLPAAAAASPPLAGVAQALQATQGTALPAAVADAVTQLLRQVARPERLTRAEGVEQALRQSGLLLESTLLAALRGQGPVPGDDLKGSLFRILARTDAALGRVEALSLAPADVEALLAMKRELEGALGRITLQQLNSLPQDLPGMRHWQLEIPIQLAGSFHSLRVDIEQERSGDGSSPTRDDDDQWRVTLQLAPPAIGAVEIRLALRGETLTARFAAARPAVRQLIDAGLPRLATALESRGITLTAGPAAELQPAARAAADAPAAGASVDLRA